MVAQNRINTVFCLQLHQNILHRIELRRLHVLQVTGKQDDVWLLGIDGINVALQYLLQ